MSHWHNEFARQPLHACRPITSMLHRDPDMRPSISHIVTRCEKALNALQRQVQ